MSNVLHIHKRYALEIREHCNEFRENTYNNVSQAALDEIIRQCFDNLDLFLPQFTQFVNSGPNFQVIPDLTYILDPDLVVIKKNIYTLYMGIYFLTVNHGIRINGRFPYLLEQISFDTCILFYDDSITLPHILIG
jgi:hypothetical protein